MNQAKIACFSGYRPEKFTFPLEAACEPYINLQLTITQAIGEAVQAGYSRFLCGMSRGFDLICAAILLEMKEMSPAYADIELVAVLPFAKHDFEGRWGVIHEKILGRVDEVITLLNKYHGGVFLKRNQYMIEQSGRLLCYFDGQPGHTANTVRSAIHQGLEIHNLADYDLQQNIPLDFPG